MPRFTKTTALSVLLGALLLAPAAAQDLETLRPVADQGAAERAKLAQVMVDSVFSFGELGFQEVETSRYLTGVLRDNGFEVEEGIAGIPTRRCGRSTTTRSGTIATWSSSGSSTRRYGRGNGRTEVS